MPLRMPRCVEIGAEVKFVKTFADPNCLGEIAAFEPRKVSIILLQDTGPLVALMQPVQGAATPNRSLI